MSQMVVLAKANLTIDVKKRLFSSPPKLLQLCASFACIVERFDMERGL